MSHVWDIESQWVPEERFMMFAVGVCDLPETGGSMFVVIAGLFVLVAGVIVTRWVRQSAGRLSVVLAPLVLLGGFVLAPQVADPCPPATTVAATTTTVAPTTTTLAPTTTTTTLAPVLYNVGDTGPGGGIVFYDAGSVQSWGRFLEAACAGWQNNCDGTTVDPRATWGCYGTPLSGADGTAIGTGEQNTAEIMAGCPDAGIAAEVADAYSNAGQTDWFLPSKDELNQMYIQQTAIGNFSSDFYWSSSEDGDYDAWSQDFGDDRKYGRSKGDSAVYVRPVRAF
jgi:hypothetical protein